VNEKKQIRRRGDRSSIGEQQEKGKALFRLRSTAGLVSTGYSYQELSALLTTLDMETESTSNPDEPVGPQGRDEPVFL
jgi:hypothetical protein